MLIKARKVFSTPSQALVHLLNRRGARDSVVVRPFLTNSFLTILG